MKSCLYILFLLSLIFNQSIFSQELNAKVVVNYEQLKSSSKENLESFSQAVEDYLNNNKFTGEDWEGEPIECNFNIFFTSSSGETKYTAQVVITSTRPIFNSNNNSLMLKIQDPTWDFNYEKNQSFYFNPEEFNPLLSFLDYYAFLIIGFDMDSYAELSGTYYFNKASNIALLGSSSNSSKGWALETSSYNKRGLVEDLLRSNFQQFRSDIFNYHYNGLDLFNEDRKTAYSNILKLVDNLDGIYDKIGRMNLLLRVFFDTKYKELYSYLEDYPDKSILQKLKRIDPSHISTYEQGLKN